MSMKTVVERITPDVAKTYLITNKGNRYLRNSLVASFARDMKNGVWKLTHQGIAFNKRGELVDGQHRLSAIIFSETTQEMMVTRDVEDDVQPAMDNGLVRGGSDHLFFAGVKRSVRYAAALRGFLRGDQLSIGRISNSELVQYNIQYGEYIAFADDRLCKKAGVKQSAVCSAIARAKYFGINPAWLERFCSVLDSGIGLSPHERTIITLRDMLMSDRMGHGTDEQREVYLKTERAIEAFVNSEVLTKIYSPKGELFPFPNGKKILMF